MVQIIGFYPGKKTDSARSWSNQDLAEFYRVESILLQAGLQVETEHGLSDEGEPWFVFCNGGDGDTIVHFALIDGRYVVAAPILPHALTGSDLREIIQRFVAENPVSIPVPDANRRDNVLFHPSALLTIFVATILVMSFPKESFSAAVQPEDSDDASRSETQSGVGEDPFYSPEEEEGQRTGEKAMLLAAVAVAVEMARQQSSEAKTDSDLPIDPLKTSVEPLVDAESGLAKAPNLLELSQEFFVSGAVADEGQSTFFDEDVRLPERIVKSEEGPFNAEGQFDLSVAGALQAPEEHYPPEIAMPEPDDVILRRGGEVAVKPTVSEPVHVAEENNYGAARNWLEEKAVAEGLSIVFLDKSQMPDIEKMVDNGKLIPSLLKDDDPTISANISPLDDEARKSILLFMSSDEDINIVGDEIGSIIIYDESDLFANENLMIKSWTFDDDTVISIVGHADTITDALALVA